MKPSLDTWTIIFLLAAAQGFFLSILIFTKKSKVNHLLGWLIAAFSLCLAYYVAFWTNYHLYLPREVGSLQGLTFVFGPLFYFYLRSDRRELYFKKWHFIPFVVYVIYFVLPPSFHFNYQGMILSVLQTAHLCLYTLLAIHHAYHQKGLKNGALKRNKWQKKLTLAFSGYSLSFLLYYILVWTQLIEVQYDYMISAASTFFIYFIGYQSFHYPDLLKMNEGRNHSAIIPDSVAQMILNKLKDRVANEKLYLESELKLQSLSDKLNFPSHYISYAINKLEGKNFSDFINEYRIEEAKKLLVQFSHYKLIEVAYSCGFNNKVSFNNAFKKFTGESPSGYRDKHEADTAHV